MNVTLHIDRMRIYAYHGVLPQERVVGANYYVTLRATVDCTDDALVGDDLSGTVNYALVCNLIREEMSVPGNLLEHVAYRTCKHILSAFPQVLDVCMLLEKENPPIGGQCDNLGVKIVLKR